MTAPRSMSALAVGLLVVAAVVLAVLWSRDAVRHPSADARGDGTTPACAPLNPSAPPPPECPQAQPPTRRAP